MNAYGTARIVSIVLSIVLVIFSAILHEIAHGWVAYKLGDPTAKMSGRLTLNPAKHLDPVGSIILPIVMAALNLPVFAYAKPVPYNPNNLRHPRTDEVWVALAGPACNLLQAGVGALVFRAVDAYLMARPQLALSAYTQGSALYWLLSALVLYVYVNLILMFFNLIPLPPLDGSKIIMPLLKGKARSYYYRIQAYSMPILIALFYLVPMVFGVDPLSWYLDATAGNLLDFLIG